MASDDPPKPTATLEQRQDMSDAYSSFIHNTSLAMLFIAPVLIAIPPRKLDLYTFFLGGTFVASANQLTKERTGAGLLSNMPGYKARMRPQVQQERRLLEESASKPGGLEEKAREMWMGGETEGWKQRRLKEEQEKIEQGEGYGGMIMDQIWEVWNWGEKKGEQLEQKDREVIEEQKRREKEEQMAREFPKIGKD